MRFTQIRALVMARTSALMIANGFMEEGDAIPNRGNNMVMTAGMWLEAESDYFRQEGRAPQQTICGILRGDT